MSKYNLLRNGSLETLTGVGFGNKSFDLSSLAYLIDGNTTSSGVALIGPDVVYLQVDLSNRIKVDDVFLYTSVSGMDSYIKFFYKNTVGSSYTQTTTLVDSTTYSTTIPDPSAPRFLLVTISGVAGSLYEFEVLNDDFVVAFGSDGQLNSAIVDDAAIGEDSSVITVPIYNNSSNTTPINAYVCVDWTDSVYDNYLYLSTTPNGAWYSIEDGVNVSSYSFANTYSWNMGVFSGTKATNNVSLLPLSITSTNLVQLPLSVAGDALNTGSNTWDYDDVNNIIYILGYNGSDYGLWSYSLPSGVMTYEAEINPAGTGTARQAVMCYLNNKIYAITNINGTFGYHDLLGAADNWTALTNVGFGFSTTVNDRIAMCSDGERYIYTVWSGYNTNNKAFKQFDTVSGTWENLGAGYSLNKSTTSNTENGNYAVLSYDSDRNVIYLALSCYKYLNDVSYIQKYDADFGWDTEFIDIHNLLNVSFSDGHAIYYRGNKLYISPDNAWNNVYYMYDVETEELDEIYLGYKHTSIAVGGANPKILVVPDNIFVSCINANTDKMINQNGNIPVNYGTYTSPVFYLSDKFMSSYFIIDGDTTPGITNISYNNSIYNGTIRVRSSDQAPIPRDEIFWARRKSPDTAYNNYVAKIVPYTNTFTSVWAIPIVDGLTSSYRRYTTVDRSTGRIATLRRMAYTLSETTSVIISDKDGVLLYSSSDSYSTQTGFMKIQFDNSAGVWYYSDKSARLWHRNSTLSTKLCEISDSTSFVYDFAVEYNGTGVWYTNPIDSVLIHLDSVGNSISSVVLPSPGAVCSTSDNGCWVVDNTTQNAYRYDYNGNVIKTVSLGTAATRMTTDHRDGFWYFIGNIVYHVDSGGTVKSTTSIGSGTISSIEAGYSGCCVFSEVDFWIKWIDAATGNLAYTYSLTSYTTAGYFGPPGVRAVDYSTYKDLHIDGDDFPVSYDPVWGVGGSLQWKEVKKDGYFLPKNTYHQAEITLHSYVGTPYLNAITMSPAMKIQDIQSQNSKNVYLKSTIPSYEDVENFDGRLKCWWGRQ